MRILVFTMHTYTIVVPEARLIEVSHMIFMILFLQVNTTLIITLEIA